LMKPSKNQNLLDVGGLPKFWLANPQPVGRIDTINLGPVAFDPEAVQTHNIRVFVGNGCDLQFSNDSYDIVFSNSVIEHVGTWEQQQQFASEVRRIAPNLWVQTPAFECPIEPHYMMPMVHYLPESIRRFAVKWFSPWSWLERPDDATIESVVRTTRLLSKKQVQQLFPDCEIVTERMLVVLPKSYIAIRRNASSLVASN
jgi:Methyltransferase domain